MKKYFQITIVRACFKLIKVKSLVTSQVVTYLDNAGLILKTPLRKLHTKGDFTNGTLRTRLIMLTKLNVQN